MNGGSQAALASRVYSTRDMTQMQSISKEASTVSSLDGGKSEVGWDGMAWDTYDEYLPYLPYVGYGGVEDE